MANPEQTAMNYALLFAGGILGMFVAHYLAFLASQVTGTTTLPYWWGYPLVFPAFASLWIHFKQSFWLSTAIVVCLAPVVYFSWYAANSVSSSLGEHPFTILFVTFAATVIVSFLAARREHLPTT